MKNLDRMQGHDVAVNSNAVRVGQTKRVESARIVKSIVATSLIVAADCLAALVAMLATTWAMALVFGAAPLLPTHAATLMGLMVLVLLFGGAYRPSQWEVGEIGGILSGVGVMVIFHAVFLTQTSGDFALLVIWPFVALAIIGARMLVRALSLFKTMLTTDVLLVGNGIDVGEFNHQQRSARGSRWNIIAQLDPKSMASFEGQELANRLDGLAAAYGSRKPITVMILPGQEEAESVQKLIERLRAIGRRYIISVDHVGLSRDAVTLRQSIGSDLILAEVDHTRQAGAGLLAKRTFDLFLSACVLVVLSPVYALVALFLAFERGPIFFSQTRVGRDGKRFECFKFRTMRVDAQERLAEILATDEAAAREWAKHQKLANDPRITKTGKFLRQTSLDELPQLFNVILGDMSFVGPRPIIAPEIEGYESDRDYSHSPEFANYTACDPGITGLWQVSGRATTTHRERVRLDRWYARNWSWTLDLLILYKTVSAVVGRSGS